MLSPSRLAPRRGSALPSHDLNGAQTLDILVLHQYYWPEIAATAQILSDLCEDLAAMGHRVTVLCGQPSYRMSGNDDMRAPSEEHHGVAIRRVWSLTSASRTIPSRLLHYGSYFASSLQQALRHKRPDVCLVMSTPPLLLGVSGTLLRALRGVPFVYSVQDLYPDVAVHLGVIEQGSILTRVVERVASACYKSASALVTLSPGMASSLRSKAIAPERIHVIPNWADTSSVKPEPRDNAFAREHGLLNSFVVQYSGNLGLSQGLMCLLGAAELLRDQPITFAFVGEGNARAELARTAVARRLTNVVFAPPQPRERLSQVLSACDLGVVCMKKGVAGDLVPSKLYGIMAAARPVLASVEATSEVARVVEEHRCGWVVQAESAQAIAEGVLTAQTDATELRVRGDAGRAACTELYARSALTRRYAHVLASVAREGSLARPESSS